MASVAALGLTLGGPATAADKYVTFAGWGGVTQEAERKAYFESAEKELGLTVREDRHGGYGGLKAHVQAGNVSWDIVGTGFAICERAVKNGLAEELDYSKIDTSNLPPEFVRPHYVGLWTFSYGIAYRADKYGDNPPQGWADFWDVKKFPGRRSLWASGRYVLEAALMADGVAPGEVYNGLMGDGGVDRAFKKLEEIKPDVAVWWTSQGQAMQLIRDGEVDMILLANGRAGALADDGAAVGFQFNQALLDVEGFMIPKGAPHPELAYEVINHSLKAMPQAMFTKHIQYGPTNPKAYDTGEISPEQAAKLPTSPENMPKQGIVSAEWYASQAGEDSLARFATFLQQ
ncbi:ABC transporter substrate-binding protein [Oceanibacterium hippocampi]|uniref:ABC transporter substrate-binding protein n=1 Tax=Oceanibacterium hippocampi TaxID=745714 RepID=UPI001FE36CDB|nr:ABC transporter substrate-binding protein [Oceanibacterium hippocampi]